MTEHGVSDSVVEQAALGWLETSGWHIAHGPEVAPGTERASSAEVVLERRRRDALKQLTPDLPEPLGEACRKLTRVEGPDLVARNRALRRLLRADVMVCIDGLALVLQELNAADGASIRSSVRKSPAAGRRAG